MRVVVVGATGNVGTAVIRRLIGAPEVDEVVGVARRLPDATSAPYDGVTWHAVDVSERVSVTALAEVFRGADAVVHLAWALQPNRDEALMWRTNVAGTAHVLEAVARASVPQILVASSVGAYSGGSKHRRVTEDWPTGGLHTSHYSRHKAIDERAYDAFEVEHPDVVLTRMRPGLVFQAPASTEIAHLFLGRRIPIGLLVRPEWPVIPLPTRLVFQAVHADDLAEAFWCAIARKAGGAFNIAAEPVLDPRRIAEVAGAGRTVPIRTGFLRGLVWLSWKLRLQRTDPGWIDIATQIPIMSTERARTVLGWTPQTSATDALAEVLDGFAHSTDMPSSPPLRSEDHR